nr:hypothetical protein HK105_007733 [Polyrhizophydium stewartii]
MIDHLLGRPSSGWKRAQILATIAAVDSAAFTVYFLRRSKRRAPLRILRRIDSLIAAWPPWKVVVATFLSAYIYDNFLHILFLNGPELYAKMYTRNFFRSTWILTSLDAGFFTCMNIRPKWLRDLLSPIASIAYLFYPEAADHKVRAFRINASVDVMRVSWEKTSNPIMAAITALDRGYLPIRRDVIIPLPTAPSRTVFHSRPKTHVNARLYFHGTKAQLAQATELIFQIPGGGFVTMAPKHHDDYTSEWARQVRIPIISINYGKAPEFPYPWALEECYEAYRSVVESNGEVIGLDGWFVKDKQGRALHAKKPIKIVMVGDSAGGNIATAVIIKCLESNDEHARPPAALISSHTSVSSLIDKKLHIRKLAPLETSEAPRAIDVIHGRSDRSKSWYHKLRPKMFEHKSTGPYIPSALSMTSRMSYFSDRVITPERGAVMRGMALLYLAGSPMIPDLVHDYYLSPVIAPEEILSRFPKTYLIVGERDPLADDAVVFAARLREAKTKARREWERVRERRQRAGSFNSSGAAGTPTSELRAGSRSVGDQLNMLSFGASAASLGSIGMDGASLPHETGTPRTQAEMDAEFERHVFSQNPDDMVKIKILEGVSHGFFQLLAVLPEAKQAVRLTAEWFKDAFHEDGDRHLVGVSGRDAPELTEMMVHEMEALEPRSSTGDAGGDFVYYPLRGVAPGGAAYQRLGAQWGGGGAVGGSGGAGAAAGGAAAAGSAGSAATTTGSGGGRGRGAMAATAALPEVAEAAVLAKRRSLMAAVLRAGA